MTIHPVGAAQKHANRHTAGWINIIRVIPAFYIYVKVPKNTQL
jgi:hypothetical protein